MNRGEAFADDHVWAGRSEPKAAHGPAGMWNPGTEPNEAVVFRVGEGEILVNVDGP